MKVPKISHKDVEYLETAIDSMQTELPELKGFILPNGHISAVMAHIARSVCRRAERRVVALSLEIDVQTHVESSAVSDDLPEPPERLHVYAGPLLQSCDGSCRRSLESDHLFSRMVGEHAVGEFGVERRPYAHHRRNYCRERRGALHGCRRISDGLGCIADQRFCPKGPGEYAASGNGRRAYFLFFADSDSGFYGNLFPSLRNAAHRDIAGAIHRHCPDRDQPVASGCLFRPWRFQHLGRQCRGAGLLWVFLWLGDFPLHAKTRASPVGCGLFEAD